MGAVAEYLNSFSRHLDQMDELASQLEGTITIGSLARHSYAPADIAYKTDYILLIASHLRLLHHALQKEAENYQEQYHATHPHIFQDAMRRCQQLKDSLFGGKLHTVKKILRSKNSPARGITMHQPYPDCVFGFCEGMVQANRQLTLVMLICRNCIQEENNIRLDTHRCLQIFDACYEKMVQKSMPFIKIILKTQIQLDPTEPKAYDLAARMRNATSQEEAICLCLHAYDESTFQLFVAHHYADKLRSQQMQSKNHERTLWADNEEMTRKAIHVMENFDCIGEEILGKRLKAGGKQHTIKSKAVLMLYQWCVDNGSLCCESRFVSFFREHYRGAHKPPILSSVNGKKNRSSFTREEYASFVKKVDNIAQGVKSVTAAAIPIGW